MSKGRTEATKKAKSVTGREDQFCQVDTAIHLNKESESIDYMK